MLEFSASLRRRQGYLDFGLGKVYSYYPNHHFGGLIVDLMLGVLLSVGLAGIGSGIAGEMKNILEKGGDVTLASELVADEYQCDIILVRYLEPLPLNEDRIVHRSWHLS